ncbi:MAG: hypothetical protein MK132_09625 [Lentisphaerales bacterium]|nr:hypothetical protein [Lentisphaerales bacterium]
MGDFDEGQWSKRNTSTSRTSRCVGKSKTSRRGPVKKKKQDNTKLFTGIGVGAFVLIFVIIAAASGASSSSNKRGSTVFKEAYSLPLSDKKIIYRDYTKVDDKLEDQTAEKISALQRDELRQKGKSIRSEKKRLLHNAKVGLISKCKKKYSGLISSYFNKNISEGIDKNW